MRIFSFLIMVLLLCMALFGQSAQVPAASTGSNSGNNAEYRIGPSDIVDVSVLRLPEVSREYHVAADGSIEMPFIGKIKAQEKTAHELAADISGQLKGGYLVDPQVSVILKQTSRKFFIQGAVHSPGVYSLEGHPTLLQLIAIAGGLNTTYGATAFILRSVKPFQPSADNAEPQPEYELHKANINALQRGEIAENITIEPGDIVQIPPADVFFVAGEVRAPGSFTLKEGSTLRQAISLAQGTSAKASPSHSVIFREENGKKREIPVDVGEIMRGRKDDVPVMPNDIIVVPNSKTKSALLPIINAFGVNATYGATRIIP